MRDLGQDAATVAERWIRPHRAAMVEVDQNLQALFENVVRLAVLHVGDKADAARIVFPGRIEYDIYVRLLQRSDVHVYLTYPFVASWSLREALAMGCVVIGSDISPGHCPVEWTAPEPPCGSVRRCPARG